MTAIRSRPFITRSNSAINWIDTAPVYGLGHSEEVVGKAIAGRREDVIVATKCSLVWDESGKMSENLTAESVLARMRSQPEAAGDET